MKKTLLALALGAGLLSSPSQASVITFDDTTFGGSGVTFDMIDWSPDVANVAQTDAGNGTIFGNELDTFIEFGSTFLVNFLSNNVSQGVLPYSTFLNYNFGGTVNVETIGSSSLLNVNFNSGSAVLTAFYQNVSTVLGTFALEGGNCLIRLSSGVGDCDIGLSFSATPGYFTYQGVDLATFGPLNAKSNLIVTVQGIQDFSPVYSGPGETQNFTINHDGNQTFTVSAPATLGLLGLGLVGMVSSRRRKVN